MSISVENHTDGSVTVSCGDQKIRVYPTAPPIEVVTDDNLTPTPWPPPPPTISLTGVVLPLAFRQLRGSTAIPIFDVGLDGNSGEPAFDRPALKRFADKHKAHGALYLKIKTPVDRSVDLDALTKEIEGLELDLGQSIVPLLGSNKD